MIEQEEGIKTITAEKAKFLVSLGVLHKLPRARLWWDSSVDKNLVFKTDDEVFFTSRKIFEVESIFIDQQGPGTILNISNDG